ncbi:single-stranded DNA-binding protein [Candidatus Marithrix sp. Canyon 246]|uniref:single-stranded DNA-binding protein n=1 Tax=Candidatus Marithrix sp. Canyon 246 TaxID=1827136 RepID=UPI00084A2A9E|nr:single-stranded DNA-binding protein [Candidatus Marithrix sp. Canyon 246]
MSKGINKVILIGILGNEPDVRYTAAGVAVVNISLATNDSWTDKQTGQRQERTEWHKVVFFKQLAEIVKQYLHSGSKIYVEGNLRTEKWQDQNGVERYTTKIMAREMQMLDGPKTGAGDNYQAQAPQQTNYAPPQQQQAAPQSPPAAAPAAAPAPTQNFDDDVPF